MRSTLLAVAFLWAISAIPVHAQNPPKPPGRSATPPREVADPTTMPAAATAVPAFRERVGPNQFQKQFEEALNRAQRSIANSIAPIAAVEIYRVYPKTTASKLKLGEYHFITGVDDQPITTITQLMAVLDDKKGHRLQLLDLDHKPQTIELPYARPLGVIFQPHWRLSLAIARDRKEPAKWDDLLTVATNERLGRTDLAETALKKAIDLGCDHWAVPLIAFDIAMTELRHDDALKLAPLVLKQAPPEFEPSIAERVASSAMLSYRVPYAVEVLQPYDKSTASQRMKQLVAIAESSRKTPQVPRTNPAAYVGALPSTDRYADVRVIASEARLQRHWEMQSRNNSPEFTLSLGDGKMTHLNLVPALRDGELRVKCRITASAKQSRAHRFVILGLIDTVAMELMGAVEISDVFSPTVSYGEQPSVRSYLPIDWNEEHTIRLIFHERDFEFLFDDTRLLYAPATVAREGRKVGFCIQNQGMSLEVTDIQWLEYGDAPKGR
jgi:hypothetical protein